MGFPRNNIRATLTTTGNGDWFFAADIEEMSYHVRNLESGGEIHVHGSNKDAKPGVGDLEATADTPFVSAIINGQALFSHKPGHRWLRFRKVQGGIPEATTVETTERWYS